MMQQDATNKKGDTVQAYDEFLQRKVHHGVEHGFEPLWIPEYLFDFQRYLTAWSIRTGRNAIFADCGLGKTIQELVWAENVTRKTGKPVLIVTPLAVSHQTVREGEKFGIECRRSHDGKITSKITVTNYERLHYFDPDDFIGVVGDESGCLKNFDGKRKALVTDFFRKRPYRLLASATAAPNDYIELGTHSEALGELGFMDMLTKFFRNNNHTSDTKGRWRGFHAPREWEGKQWRFKSHAERPFWQWICSWARALRKPSDFGFDDQGFVLPPLIEQETVVSNRRRLEGELFVRAAISLAEQREERRITLQERCEKVAELVAHDRPALVWCHLNPEGDLLEKLIPDAVQIAGSDTDEAKEEAFLGFVSGAIRVLITKPKIGAFGLNFQHCAHMTMFPSHSFEQHYQGVRRCWRFGQQSPVTVDIVTSEGELNVLKNLQRKALAADRMFASLILYMNNAMQMQSRHAFALPEEVPSWL